MNLNLRCSNQVVEDRHLEALQKVCEGRFSTGRREESVAMMCSYRKSSRYIYIYIFFFWGGLRRDFVASFLLICLYSKNAPLSAFSLCSGMYLDLGPCMLMSNFRCLSYKTPISIGQSKCKRRPFFGCWAVCHGCSCDEDSCATAVRKGSCFWGGQWCRHLKPYQPHPTGERNTNPSIIQGFKVSFVWKMVTFLDGFGAKPQIWKWCDAGSLFVRTGRYPKHKTVFCKAFSQNLLGS